MRKKGFTLVEIMIVVGIISFLAGMAILNLLRARANANEASAISALRTIATVATGYRAVNPSYPLTLSSLASPNVTPSYIDSVLGCESQPCVKQGYNFILTGATDTFTATAEPQAPGGTGNRRFFVDESGVVRYSISGPATSLSPALD